MLDLLAGNALDPALAELLFTLGLVGLVLIGGAVALLMLPWTDDEIADVHAQARTAFRPVLRRATLRT